MFDFLAPYYGYGSDLLKWVLAIIFIVHGWPKMMNPAMAAGIWRGSKPAAMVHGIVEVLAGVMVALEYNADWALAAMVVIMVGAIYFKVVKWKTGFVGKNGTGWEFDLLILATAIAFLLG